MIISDTSVITNLISIEHIFLLKLLLMDKLIQYSTFSTFWISPVLYDKILVLAGKIEAE